MFFYKKVLVLKRTDSGIYDSIRNISGIARLETESDVSELHLSLINLPLVPQGYYYAFIIDSANQTFCFPLGLRPISLYKTFPFTPRTQNGFAIGILMVKDNIPLTMLFARTDEFSSSLSDFKKIADTYCLNKFNEKKDAEPPVVTDSSEFNRASTLYNDEAVATENYYLFDKNDEINLKAENINESRTTENDHAYRKCKEETEQSRQSTCSTENETNYAYGEELSQKEWYYERVKSELSEIFEKFPKENNLSGIIPSSKWVKIQYNEKKYYVVGLIKENQREKYICYGIPANYSDAPPEQLKGYSSFIPLSIFDLYGKGYWMMFQDATNGKCVHLTTTK